MTRGTSSHQTIGPFWHGLATEEMRDATRFGAQGSKVVLQGRITDGDGALVTDACVEVWQASPPADDIFPGWARCATDPEGKFRVTTLHPDSVPNDTGQAPHVAVLVHARGLLKPLLTRMYFEGHPMNERDPVLQSVAPARRSTLVARAVAEGTWQLDIRLQGEGETVFFEV